MPALLCTELNNGFGLPCRMWCVLNQYLTTHWPGPLCRKYKQVGSCIL